MNCKYHNEEEAKFICDKCKMPICEKCAIEVRGNKVCTGCIDHSVYAERNYVERITLWSKLTFFIFACIPGAAQMQMGLFKRGMQLMLTFIGAIVLGTYTTVESIIPLIIIPTWFFSFFDAYNARKKHLAGEIIADTEAYNYQILINNKKFLGVTLLVLGLMGIFNSIEMSMYRETVVLGISMNEVHWVFKRAIIPIIFVFSGVLLLFRTKKADKEISE